MTNLTKNQGASVLTTEAIHTQDDVVFVDKMLSVLDAMRSYVVANNIVDNFKPTNDVEFIKIVTNLNHILTNRFGVKINLLASSNSVLSTNTIFPPEYNVLLGDASVYYQWLSKKYKDAKVEKGAIHDTEKEQEKMYNKIYNSFKSLKSKMETSNVFVDLKNAKIYNAPENMFIFINYMPGMLFSEKIGLDNREILSAILHEVGHNITSIYNSFKHITNTTVVLDAMHETINVRNGSPLDGIKLSYKNLTGKELKSKTVINAAVALKSVYSGVGVNGDDNLVSTSTDAEILADQFAARFLLGDALVSGLLKLGSHSRPNTQVESFMLYIHENALLTVMISIAVWPVAVMMPFYIFGLLVNSVSDLKQYNKTGRVYPDFTKRMLRIKQDSVRQIRLLKDNPSNKATIDKLVEVVDSININLDMFKDNKSLTTKIVESFQYSKDDENLLAFNDTIINLMENDLHHISAKI